MIYLSSESFSGDAATALANNIWMFAPPRPWLNTSWNANAYTGSGITYNGSNQLGYNDLNRGYGSTTIQTAPGKISLFLNGYSTETHTHPHYVHQWSMGVSNKAYAGNDRPWTNGKWLHVGARISIKHQYFDSACGYSYLVLPVYDTKSGLAVHLLYQLSDSRSGFGHGAFAGVSIEAGNNPVAFAQVGVHSANTAYMQNLGANGVRGRGDSVSNFWFLVGPAHLQTLLNHCRSLPGFASLSTNAEDYVLQGASFQPELAALSGQPRYIPGQFGWTVEWCAVLSQ